MIYFMDIDGDEFAEFLFKYHKTSEFYITLLESKFSEVYATEDPLLYSGSDYSKMRVVGIELNEEDYIKEWNLGNTAEIIPRLSGGNVTQYKCDMHYGYLYSGGEPYELIFGGLATWGGRAGIGTSNSDSGVSWSDSSINFRSVVMI